MVATHPTTESTATLSATGLRAGAGLLPLGAAALIAALVYGGIVSAAALTAPRQAPPLIRRVAMTTTVRDGNWSYRVLGLTSVPALPGGIARPVDPAHHYTLVHLRLYNALSRPFHIRLEVFDLTGDNGLRSPLLADMRGPIAQLYHLTPVGMQIPPHSAMDGVLMYLVRNNTQHLDLLGPGFALVHLY